MKNIHLNNIPKKKKKHTSDAFHIGDLAFLLPSLLGVSIFVLIPFLDVIRRSFLNVVGNKIVYFQNYKNVIENTAFQTAVKNTGIFMAVAIPLLILLSMVIAIMLNEGMKGAGLYKTGFLLPMAIPVASVVLILRALFYKNGYVSAIYAAFGGTPKNWLSTGYSIWILVGIYVWRNLGYNVVLWLAGLAGIPKALQEAAEMDGANTLQRFWYVTMPNLLPSLYMISVLAILNSFKVFREGYLISGNYPDRHMYLIQHIFNNWFRELSLGKMAAAAVLVCLVILLLIVILQKFWDKDGEA